MDPAAFFWFVLRASLLSSGGFGNLPLLHQDLVAHGATDSQFATALAIGQLAPGPSGLWVVALGYLLGGVVPALLAAVAVVFPPLLIVPVARVHTRYADQPAVRGFVRGLVLAVAATVPVVFLRVVAVGGIDMLAVALIAGSAVVIASRRVPLIIVLATGAVVGALAYR
ncbi:MAG: chromate transporter [Candidatus Dormibacteraeota bacterium]|nr:chromate transporter [Candidatus Dormibacteraeota bacterium]